MRCVRSLVAETSSCRFRPKQCKHARSVDLSTLTLLAILVIRVAVKSLHDVVVVQQMVALAARAAWR